MGAGLFITPLIDCLFDATGDPLVERAGLLAPAPRATGDTTGGGCADLPLVRCGRGFDHGSRPCHGRRHSRIEDSRTASQFRRSGLMRILSERASDVAPSSVFVVDHKSS